MKFRQPKHRKIYKMIKGLGCNSFIVDGNNPFKIYKNISESIKYIKSGKGPVFGEFLTYRHREHCGPNFDDHLNYRPKNEIKYWFKKRSTCIFRK